MENEINKYEIRENIIAFRTLDYEDLLRCSKLLNKIKKGDVLVDKGFMSLGLVYKSLIAEHDYFDTIIKIYIPKKCKALYVDFVSKEKMNKN